MKTHVIPNAGALDPERCIDITDAAHRTPGTRRARVCRNVLHRWCTKGWTAKGLAFALVLRTEWHRGKRQLNPEWLDQFLKEKASAERQAREKPRPIAGVNVAAHRAACKRLRAQGLTIPEGGVA